MPKQWPPTAWPHAGMWSQQPKNAATSHKQCPCDQKILANPAMTVAVHWLQAQPRPDCAVQRRNHMACTQLHQQGRQSDLPFLARHTLKGTQLEPGSYSITACLVAAVSAMLPPPHTSRNNTCLCAVPTLHDKERAATTASRAVCTICYEQTTSFRLLGGQRPN